jgi:hypothetical protein
MSNRLSSNNAAIMSLPMMATLSNCNLDQLYFGKVFVSMKDPSNSTVT